VREQFGGFEKGIAAGLGIDSDSPEPLDDPHDLRPVRKSDE
jgi:hypothetical protein